MAYGTHSYSKRAPACLRHLAAVGTAFRSATNANEARMTMRSPFVIAIVSLVLLYGAEVLACATCACGDPTLTVMGTEQPFAGRLRLSASFDLRSETSGLTERTSIEEQRLGFGTSYAIVDWLQVSLSVPLVRKHVTAPDLSTDTTYNLGDLDLRARAVVWRDRNFAPRHLLSFNVGAELPTTPLLEHNDGTSLAVEAQAGTGSLDPMFGLSYAFFANPISLFASTTAMISTRGHHEILAGPALLTSITAQVQPFEVLAFRLGLDTRVDAPALIGDEQDEDTGGFIAFVSPEVVLRAYMDWLVRVAIRVPVFHRLRGARDEGLMMTVGVAHDL